MLVVVQPRSFQVTVTKRRQVTASWKRPHGISYTEGWRSMMCVVMSSNGDGAMEKCTKVIELKLYLFIYLFCLIVCLKYTICTVDMKTYLSSAVKCR